MSHIVAMGKNDDGEPLLLLFEGDSVGAILDEEEEMVTDIVVGDQIVTHDLFDEYQNL